MPGSVRIVFDPRAHQVRGELAVVGGTLDLARFGKNPSQVKPDQEHAARLVFHAAFIDKPRKVSKPSFSPFAKLSGKVKLEGTTPKFVLAPDAKLEHDGPDAERPRRLKLQYGLTFVNQAADAAAVGELKLPEAPPGARFFELGIELEVDGAAEASVDQNDRLDVPLDGVSFFEAELLDEQDQPLASRDFELELPDGSVVKGQSDAAGVVGVDPVPRGECVLRVVSPAG
jgi:hypothetical protein